MKRSGDLNGFLDRGSAFQGELEFEDTMRIDGRFTGKIRSKNELIIGESAVIDAEISVGRVAISGMVRGTIRADEKIEIHKAGRVFCEITTPNLLIEEGATFQGSCSMPGAGERANAPVRGAKGSASAPAAAMGEIE